MSGTFFGFNTALRGLFAQQKAINTTAHNIANANTPGFTRQQAIMETTAPFPLPSLNRPGGAGQLGTGVDVAEIRRIRDLFLDKQIRVELQSLGRYEEEWKTMGQVETIFMEPGDTGLSKIFDDFWQAWSELSKNAENSPIRTSLKELSVTLADNLNHLARQLDTVYNDLNQVAAIRVSEINAITNKIASLNGQIEAIQAAGDQPNDLRDQRDALLDDLAKIIDYSYEETNTGSINIQINVLDNSVSPPSEQAVNLVDGNKVNLLSFSDDPAIKGDEKLQLTVAGPPDVVYQVVVKNGQMKGLENTRQNVNKYREDLNTLVSTLADEINKLHQTGYSLGATAPSGINFFEYDATDPALTIGLNSAIANDVSKIAASSTPGSDNKGDGEIALKIYQLSRTALDGLGKSTIGNYYKNFISSIGVTANAAKTNEFNQQALVDQLNGRKESVSGVSIDEEMANMMMFQRSYEAAAKIITTLDEMIQTVLGLKR